jgi:predicted amidohydrolase
MFPLRIGYLLRNRIDNYWIACAQFFGKAGQAGDSDDKFKEARKENVRSYQAMIERACGGNVPKDNFAWDETTALIVFPEMSLAGLPNSKAYARKGIPIQEWVEKAAVYIPGEETEAIAKKTSEYGVYLIGNGFEREDSFPGAFFNCSFVMSPDGRILTKYRRLHSLAVSPDDILDDYIKKVGWDGMFPVVDTPLGKLGALACGEIKFPEVGRMFGMKGVEVLAHCDSAGNPEPGLEAESNPTSLAWSFCRRARAIENKCYIPRANSRGGNEIVDFYGRTLARTLSHAPMELVKAPVSMSLLREAKKSKIHNQVARLRTRVFAHFYNEFDSWPSNEWSGKKIPGDLEKAREDHWRRTIEKGYELGYLRKDDEE